MQKVKLYSGAMKHILRHSLTVLPLFWLSATTVWADTAVVEQVQAQKTGATWAFSVTLRHADTGWDHYADGWGIYLPDGTELGYRVLAHPHVNEQPFTRSLNGVVIPQGTKAVVVIAKDSVHGVGAEFRVELR